MRFFIEGQPVPSEFWKSNTGSLACMHDTESFVGPVYSYPVKKNSAGWVVRGQFCSLNCAKAYMMERDDSNLCSLFTLMCKEVYGIQSTVTAAPPACILQKYTPLGDGVDIQTFRTMSGKVLVQVLNKGVLPFQYDPTNLSLSKVCHQILQDDHESTHQPQTEDSKTQSSDNNNPLSVCTLDKLIKRQGKSSKNKN